MTLLSMELPYQAEAIILSSDDFKDKDRIITAYTRDMGKIRGISRGSRKTTSKLAPHLETLGYVNLMLFDGKALTTITGASEIKDFRNLKNNLDNAMIALYSAELVNRSTLEKLPDEKIFNLLFELFEYLDKKIIGKDTRPTAEETVLAFKLKLLDILGLRPLEIEGEHKEGLKIIESGFSELENIDWKALGKEKLEKIMDYSLTDVFGRPVVDFSKYIQ